MDDVKDGRLTADTSEIAEWVAKTCLIFGTTAETAYKVAAYFITGLDRATLPDDTKSKAPAHD